MSHVYSHCWHALSLPVQSPKHPSDTRKACPLTSRSAYEDCPSTTDPPLQTHSYGSLASQLAKDSERRDIQKIMYSQRQRFGRDAGNQLRMTRGILRYSSHLPSQSHATSIHSSRPISFPLSTHFPPCLLGLPSTTNSPLQILSHPCFFAGEGLIGLAAAALLGDWRALTGDCVCERTVSRCRCRDLTLLDGDLDLALAWAWNLWGESAARSS